MRCVRWLTVLAMSLVVAGCESTPSNPGKPLTGDPLIDGQNAIASGPAKDKVLWQYRTALVAMRRGQFAEAKGLLDDALSRISNVIGKDPSARESRSMFSPEAKKTFIGEPYERVMAYYYRGIIYWMDGEPDNARACFRSAALEDSGTKDKKFASDYVLLDYLDGLASLKLGGDGSDAFKRAEGEAKMFHPPAANAKANVLIFVDFAYGPTKYAMGQHAELLNFRAGGSPVRTAQVQVDQQHYQLPPYDDLFFQATTRGGRVMDHILANKAGFKTATDVAGNVGLVGGAALATQHDTQMVGLGLLAAGLFSKVLSASTRPEADVRSWDNLPLFLSFTALELPPGPHTLTVEFLDDANRVLAGQTKTITIDVPAAPADKVVYVSDQSSTPQTQ